MSSISSIYRLGTPYQNEVGKLLENEQRTFVAYLVVGIIYRLILDYSILMPLQVYTGPQYTIDPSIPKWILSMILTVALLIFVPKKDGATSLVMQLGLLYIVLPIVAVYALRNESTIFFSLVSITYLIAQLIISAVTDESAAHEIRGEKHRYQSGMNVSIVFILTIIVVVFFLGMFATQGIPSLSTLNLSTIYSLRSETGFPELMQRLMSPVAKVILPFFLIVGILRKNLALTSTALILELLVFLWSGNKIYLFMAGVVLVVTLFYRRDRNLLIFILFVLMVGICSLSQLLTYIPGLESLIWPFSLIVRRSLYLPAAIKYYYFDYFHGIEHPWNFARSQLFHIALGPEVSQDYQYEIGAKYFGSYNTNVNAGMYGEEMASFGAGGIIVASMFYAGYALIVFYSARKNGHRYALAASLPLLLDFANASIVKGMTRDYGIIAIALLLIFKFEGCSSKRIPEADR